MRNEPELRILCPLRSRVARVRDDEASRATEDRLSMTYKALVSVMPCPQPIGIGACLREHGIQFAGNRGTIYYVGTTIARGFQLTGSQNSFLEGCALVFVDCRARSWMGANQRKRARIL